MFGFDLRFWHVAVVAALTSLSAQAEDLALYTADLPGLHQPDGGGKYDIFLNKVAETAGISLKIHYWPVGRAITAFQSCDNCCANPCAQAPGIDYCKGAVLSKALSATQLYIFTPSGKRPLTLADDLSEKVLGKILGMQIGETLPLSGAELVDLPDFATALAMMDLGRIDALVAWAPDLPTYLSQNERAPLSYNINAPVISLSEHLGCKGKLGQKLIDAVNASRAHLLK